MRSLSEPIALAAAMLALAACAGGTSSASAQQQTLTPIAEDTTGRASVPVGYGTLRQDDIAIRMELPGLIVRAIPLEENLIRLLTPDSYRALRELQESNQQAIAAVSRRTGGRPPDGAGDHEQRSRLSTARSPPTQLGVWRAATEAAGGAERDLSLR